MKKKLLFNYIIFFISQNYKVWSRFLTFFLFFGKIIQIKMSSCIGLSNLIKFWFWDFFSSNHSFLFFLLPVDVVQPLYIKFKLNI